MVGRSLGFAAAAAMAVLPYTVSGHAHEGVGFHIPHAERRDNEPFLAELRARYGYAPARVIDDHLERRQAPSSAPASAASSTHLAGGASSSHAAGSSAAPAASGLSMGTIPIGTTTTMAETSPLPTTYAAGATSPVLDAPVLPAVNINPADWPALDRVPPLDSPQVQQWISQIDWTKVPNIPVTQLGGCSNASNAQSVADAATNGWWTCGGHTRATDVVSCPEKNTWGLSYDDGPSPDTPRLLQFLDDHQLKSTFFVVGSRAISRPQILQYEYLAGHQISVHTWSHGYLTTKTNEEIVAELGWTKESMKQILGVTPNTMRPPYGDIDDRVRAISLQMGLRPIIWTSVNGTSYDTFDWQVAGGIVNADTVVQKFQSIIDGAESLDTGFIVLEHDLYQQSTSLAIDYVMPYAFTKPNLKLEAIFQCLGQTLDDVYIETAENNTADASSATSLDRGSSATAAVSVAVTTSRNTSGIAGAAAGGSGAGSQLSSTPVLSAVAAIVVAGLAYAL